MNDSERLYKEAACKGANPALFDSKNSRVIRTALDMCLGCPVTDLCRETVLAPYEGDRPYFDGVAGGRVWAKGKDVTQAVLARADDQAVKASGLYTLSPYKPIDWAYVTDVMNGDQDNERLTSAEKYAGVIMMYEAEYPTDVAAERLGMSAFTVRKYRSVVRTRLNPNDIHRAAEIGFRHRDRAQAA